MFKKVRIAGETNKLNKFWPVFGLAMIAALIISIGLLSCAAGGEKMFSDKDSGAKIVLNQGENFAVKLESNQTTGYSWKLSDEMDSGVVTMLSSIYEVPKTDKEMVGSGGFETFSFKAAAPGKTEILLEYLRPWEEGIEPEGTFIIYVEVR